MLAGNFMLDTRTCVLYNVNRIHVRKNKMREMKHTRTSNSRLYGYEISVSMLHLEWLVGAYSEVMEWMLD